MQHDQFIGLVQDRAALDSRGAAEAATRATLETLAERLGSGLPEKIGDQFDRVKDELPADYDALFDFSFAQ